MEYEIQQLRNRVSSLQSDLETSEAVQRDFVQLSQQLQVANITSYFCIVFLYLLLQGFVWYIKPTLFFYVLGST